MNIIIYCRVSSKEQVDGTSLASQETACREFANRNGWDIVEVFVEEGESAKFADRTKLLELMEFCKNKKRNVAALLVWKVDRLARNIEDHYMIKATLRRVGVKVVSVTEPLDADPNGKLMEAILAGFAQFDNDIRAMRTTEGLRKRLREGISPRCPPLGYLPTKMRRKREPDRPDPACFGLIQKGWRLFVNGGYTRAEILRILRSLGVRGRQGRPLSIHTLEHILTNPFYAGILRIPGTGEEIQGQHVAMVTTEEFAMTQLLLKKKSVLRAYVKARSDFPLRGLVRCSTCKWPMTASWTRSLAGRYAYYSCHQRQCVRYRKSVPASIVHAEFEAFLQRVATPAPVTNAVLRMITKARLDKQGMEREAAAKRRERVGILERQLTNLVSLRADQLVSDREFISVRDNLRRRILELQADGISDRGNSLRPTETSGLVQALADIPRLWSGLDTLEKRAFGRTLMPAGYVHGEIQTAELSLLFRVLSHTRGDNSLAVAPEVENPNPIIASIRQFLKAIGRSWKPEAQAA